MLDPGAVDWSRVKHSSYLIHHRLRYQYPTPIEDLEHHLAVVPRLNHGTQSRVDYRLDVSSENHVRTIRQDAFGNLVVDLAVPRVDASIDFEAWVVVERHRGEGPVPVRGAALRDRRLLDGSPLTQPDEALRDSAAALQASGAHGFGLAMAIMAWVSEAMRYTPGVTGVKTTAAAALALGEGVCQDYAHVMIALCRLCGLPSRYVSGHLLGEGAMHAWVEVLLPSAERPGDGLAWPFDPTHARLAMPGYLTVAVGRDFSDVSPTWGTFRAPAGGWLASQQSARLTAVQYL